MGKPGQAARKIIAICLRQASAADSSLLEWLDGCVANDVASPGAHNRYWIDSSMQLQSGHSHNCRRPVRVAQHSTNSPNSPDFLLEANFSNLPTLAFAEPRLVIVSAERLQRWQQHGQLANQPEPPRLQVGVGSQDLRQDDGQTTKGIEARARARYRVALLSSCFSDLSS